MIRVFLIDDSASVRAVFTAIFEKHADIELTGTALDPIFAQRKMEKDWPDVIILDLNMPRMNGLDFLKKVMRTRPTPVIVCSSLTQENAPETLDALALGAVSVIGKPTLGVSDYLTGNEDEIIDLVRAAAESRIARRAQAVKAAAVREGRQVAAAVPRKVPVAVRPSPPAGAENYEGARIDRLIAIGTSAGGTKVLEEIFDNLQPPLCPIVVVQHMPEKYTDAFARRLDLHSALHIKEAENDEPLMNNTAYIAQGGTHLLVRQNGNRLRTLLQKSALVSNHRPSADVLFRSVAALKNITCYGIILTGMGKDGARGLLEMHQAGIHTVAQDEASCLVYGMPREAVKLGAVDESMSIENIIRYIQRSGTCLKTS